MRGNLMSNFLYKIYYDDTLIYLGRTRQKLQSRLHGHFFKAPMLRVINIKSVSRIEYAEFKTEADMFLYEIYYINKLKPPFNRDDKSKEILTIHLPEVVFVPFECKLMGKWNKQIEQMDRAEELRRKIKYDFEIKKIEARRTMSHDKYLQWLERQEDSNIFNT